MAITFYFSPFSSAVRTHWALEELGIPYDGVRMDLKAGEQKKPDFLKLNPNGKVPTIVDDGVPYFESAAINIYLGEKYGVAKGLWPKAGTHAHGRAMSWTVWAAASLLNAGTRVMHNTSPEVPDEQKNAAQGESARKEFEGLLDLLDAELKDKPYLTGDAFTLADALLAADLWWYQMVIVPSLARWPHVQAWTDRCRERPAFKRISTG
ncbi:glutathione S-transferase family protein [Polyangium jinanense]|uniref:Glutathione S-transferase family protein n=1 Tax=Polyangium jinanense TaxID=2829994 RepID=A0A9X3X5K6_9BACT|nr:glutathione S-transferase family protein [Polyangium jinanense]MDC3955465.1 glutathione S-transferase family protein [Polyangium jinanense]MDC3981766.1 glutathione S-transferase family protein [Polyangium jinanense]